MSPPQLRVGTLISSICGSHHKPLLLNAHPITMTTHPMTRTTGEMAEPRDMTLTLHWESSSWRLILRWHHFPCHSSGKTSGA